MNLANKSFKAAFKNFFKNLKQKTVQTLGESATAVSAKKTQTITDPERISQIGENVKEFSENIAMQRYSAKGMREAERTADVLTKRQIEIGENAFEEAMTNPYRGIDSAFDRLFENKYPSPEERSKELNEVKETIRAYFADPKFPIDLSDTMKFIDSNDFKMARESIRDHFVQNSLMQKNASITEGLNDVFVNPEVVKNMIDANREVRLKSIFQPQEKDGKTLPSKFEQAKKKFITQETKKMGKADQTEFIKTFEEKYKLPDDVTKATSADLRTHIEWYNKNVPDKENVHYNLRDEIQDKVRIWSEVGTDLKEMIGDLSAKELTENTVLKLAQTGSGLVTNMAKAYSWFRGVEDFTAKSIGKAIDYMEQLPKFKTRNNELLMAAGIEMDRWGSKRGLSKDEQRKLQENIRYYIENVNGEKLAKVDYNGRALTADIDLAQQLNLQQEDVEFANKIINAFRLSKKHMDFVTDSLYEQAGNLNHVFKDIDGLELEDISLLNRNHPTFGFVENYFPIVPNEQYKEYLMKLQASNDQTGVGYVARQMSELMKAKKDDLAFFTKMRRLGKDSVLKQSPSYRMSPAEEIITHAKAVNNFYKTRGYTYFDQMELSHSVYDIMKVSGKDESYARLKLLENMRTQYDEAMNPKGLGESTVAQILSGALTLEMTAALSSPRMAFFNALQGLDLGGSMTGYRNHIKAVIKNTFGAAGWALHNKLTKGEGYFGNGKFIEQCYTGKFNKQLFGDDAIIANNIGAYFKDEPITSLINMADANYLLTKGVEEKLRLQNTVVGRTLNNLKDAANYLFAVSEKIARASTIDASTKHFLDSARKTIAHIKAHPEMSNPEAVVFLAKELHLDALNNAWKVNKILDNLKVADSVTDALSNNQVLQRMSQDYAFACVKHQIFEYDAINQSWLKAKWKHTSAYLGIPLTFKSWGMHFTEYFAGLAAAAYNGDPKPLIRFGTQALGTIVAATYVAELGEGEKYKKGSQQDFENWLKKGISNSAKYYRGRNVAFTPVSIIQQPLDPMAGLTQPLFGGALYAAAKVASLTKYLPGISEDNVVYPWLESKAAEISMNPVILRKARDLRDNLRELKVLPESKK